MWNGRTLWCPEEYIDDRHGAIIAVEPFNDSRQTSQGRYPEHRRSYKLDECLMVSLVQEPMTIDTYSNVSNVMPQRLAPPNLSS